MDFLEHLTEYYRGERLGAICFWWPAFYSSCSRSRSGGGGTGTIARGMLGALLVIAVLGTVAGPLLWRSNIERLVRLPQEPPGRCRMPW